MSSGDQANSTEITLLVQFNTLQLLRGISEDICCVFDILALLFVQSRVLEIDSQQ